MAETEIQRLIRVLIVDDFPSWRVKLCDSLKSHPEILLVGEAADGKSALENASKYQPDLILLDIGLPDISGLQVAKQLSRIAPRAEILFLSADHSHETVRMAFESGARGYVLKSNAGSQLTSAISAVRRGDRFVSSGISDPCKTGHLIQFYADDECLADCAGEFLGRALRDGQSAIVIGTQTHRTAIERRLRLQHIDIDGFGRDGRFTTLDAPETLSKIMDGNLPDPQIVQSLFGSIIERAEAAAYDKSKPVPFFGELAPLLCAEKKFKAAQALEKLADRAIADRPVCLRCAYPHDILHREGEPDFYSAICADHAAVIAAPKWVASPG